MIYCTLIDFAQESDGVQPEAEPGGCESRADLQSDVQQEGADGGDHDGDGARAAQGLGDAQGGDGNIGISHGQEVSIVCGQ